MNKGHNKKLRRLSLYVKRLCLTLSVVQQKEDSVFRDDELSQLHHVGHGERHNSLLSLPTVTAFPQSLQQNMCCTTRSDKERKDFICCWVLPKNEKLAKEKPSINKVSSAPQGNPKSLDSSSYMRHLI